MIATLALRIAARQALLGATTAGARVYDSAVSSIEDLISEAPTPFVVVSSDDQTADVTVRDVLGGARKLDLVIEVAVGSAVEFEGATVIVVPNSDAGLELSVNLLCRQVVRTLFDPTGTGAWARVFRAIASGVDRISIRRGAGADKGTRFAAAQIVLSLSPLYEPAFGSAPAGPWADFVAAVRADTATAPLGDLIEAAIVGDEIPDWQALYAILGVDDAGAARIGLAPFIQPPEEPAELSAIDLGDVVVTEELAEEQIPEEPTP